MLNELMRLRKEQKEKEQEKAWVAEDPDYYYLRYIHNDMRGSWWVSVFENNELRTAVVEACIDPLFIIHYQQNSSGDLIYRNEKPILITRTRFYVGELKLRILKERFELYREGLQQRWK